MPATDSASDPDGAPGHDTAAIDVPQFPDGAAPADVHPDGPAPPDATSPDTGQVPDAAPDAPAADTTVADAAADVAHPNAAAELTDPARPSFPHECDGTLLTAPELIGLFQPGAGALVVGLGAPPDLTAKIVSRTCVPLTGCSEWTEKDTTTNFLAFALYFELPSASSLSAQIYDSGWGSFNARDVIAVSGGELLFVDDPHFRPRRALITRRSSGELCVSVATTVNVSGWPTQHQDYIVARGTLSAPPAGSALAQQPLTGFTSCGAPEPSTAALAAAWFAPGTSSVGLANAPGECQTAHRLCHAVTGCSPWNETFSCTSVPVVTGLAVSSSGDEIQVHLVRGSNHRYPTVTAGTYSEKFFDWQVDGTVNTTCIDWHATLQTTAPHLGTGFLYERSTNQWQTRGRIDR